MNSSKKITSEILSAAIMFILFLVMLLLVVFSATAYKSSVTAQSVNNDARAVLSYVITAVKSNKTDDIRLIPVDGVDTLVMTDGQTGFEQRIYYRDGQLLENYGMTGTEFPKDSETVIGRTDYFEMNLMEDELLEIRTSYGSSFVNIGY